jgi:hypothetical protein
MVDRVAHIRPDFPKPGSKLMALIAHASKRIGIPARPESGSRSYTIPTPLDETSVSTTSLTQIRHNSARSGGNKLFLCQCVDDAGGLT